MSMKMYTVRFFLLDHEDDVSGEMFHFIMVSSNRNKIPRHLCFFAGKYLPPEILYSKMFFFSRTSFCQPIFKMFSAHFATN